jgi:23S rRNA pseudouridine2605 synthase
MSAKVRINRYLAAAGFGSRRKCEELIRQGLVSVNGCAVDALARMVETETDVIAVGGRAVSSVEAARVLVLKKPIGVLCTVSDSFRRRTVIDIARECGYTERLFPVGRLDLNTSGILILTNDGDLAYRLTHPRFKIEKTYRVVIAGTITEETVGRISAGIDLNGQATRPCAITVDARGDQTTTLTVVLGEGRKRQIRRMFARFGHKVIELERTAIGDLKFADLAPGSMRPLSGREEDRLRELAGLAREGKEKPVCQ